MINIQPMEKASLGDGNSLSLHSIFYTIQGEGIFAGWPAVFIRLAGCNLQCSGCDTDYTEGRTIQPVKDIVSSVIRSTGHTNPNKLLQSLVVITGGEPFRQNLLPLIRELHKHNLQVQIETNGTLPPPDELPYNVVIMCSPKTPRINEKLAKRADFFKYVLSHRSIHSDGLPFNVLDERNKLYVARPPEGYTNPIYLQPMDSQDAIENVLNVQAVVESCKKFGYVVQLQVHKLLGVP